VRLSGRNDSVTQRNAVPRADLPGGQALLLVVGSNEGCETYRDDRVASFTTTLLVGRRVSGEATEAVLVVRDSTVSSRHLTISSTHHGEFELTDLGSTNGTFVNGELVRTSTTLQDGAVIFAGNHVMVFRTGRPSQIEAIFHELSSPMGPLATVNPRFALTCQRMRLLAATDEDVLLSGERGVGKESYARAIHRASGRKGEFVSFDCGATPAELTEATLFGSAIGRPSRGLLEQAEGGTLFLDEVAELAPALLAKLVRLTDHSRIAPLLAAPSRRIDVRIVAATSRTVGDSSVRQDFEALFGSEPIIVPPLRERIEDLGLLAHHLLAGRKPFDLTAFQALCLHNWPGNLRELRKTLASAEAFAQESERIGLEHLPTGISATPRIRSGPRRRRPRPPPTPAELQVIFQRFRGNVLRISRELDRKPAVIYRWARRFGLEVKGFRSARHSN
jgi:transcriptional regulator with PAS, ATPase and Fis domain